MKTLLDTWSEEQKRARDNLDRTVAALLIVDENGAIRPRDNLTDHEIQLIDRWEAREHDPGYLRACLRILFGRKG